MTVPDNVKVAKDYHFFSMYQCCKCAGLVKIHPLVKGADLVADFHSLYRMVTLKINSRLPKSNHFFYCVTMMPYIKFDQNL